MSIRKSTPPNLIGKPNIPLQQNDQYEALIWNKGYDIIIENAIECPCKGKSGSPKTTCKSCLGLGWIFVNPLATKAIITSANSSTKYKHWSPELTGTVNVTVKDSERVALMDKITFTNKTNILSEVRPVITIGTEKFVFTSFKVRKILSVYIFKSDTEKLTKLSNSQYTVASNNSMVVKLTDITYPTNFNDVITIEYEYLASYNIIDMPHDFRSSFITDNNGKIQDISLPVQAVARKSNQVLGYHTNYDGSNLLDNSD